MKSEFDEALIKIEQSNENQLDLKILKSLVLRKKELFNASITVGKDALHEAQESNSLQHELGAFVQLSYAHSMIHQLDKANIYVSEFDSIWKGLSDNENEKFKELEGYIYHVKGLLNSFQSEINQSIVNYEKSLAIQTTIENSLEILSTLNNIVISYISIGAYKEGLTYAKQQFDLAEELDQQLGIVYAFSNLGHLEEIKGEYDLALDYITRGLNIADELKVSFTIASCMDQIGRIYYLKGEYDLAFKNLAKSLIVLEDLDMHIYVAKTIFHLIKVSIKLGLINQTENYMKKLNKLYESNQVKTINLYKKMSQAIILKNNPRSKEKISSQKIFEEIITENLDVDITSSAILHLSELLLDELKLYGSGEVLDEIEDKTLQLYELAQEHQLFPLIVKVLVLRAKLSFLKLELDEATKILHQANLIAEERGLTNLVSTVDQESKKLENEIRLAVEITRKASTIQDRMNKAEIIEYIEKMQHLISIGQ